MDLSYEQRPRLDYPIIAFIGLAHILAILALPLVSIPALVAFFCFYGVTVLGVTMGYHRYFTHRSFEAHPLLTYGLAICGTLALQGSIRDWVSHHRLHHAGSDTERDPHDASRGFWYAHVLWLFAVDPDIDDPTMRNRLCRDIDADPILRFLSRPSTIFGLQLALGLTLWGLWGFEAMMWGVWVRLVAVWHVTWFVNSACHKFGYKNFDCGDLSTNCWWVALLSFGEGWHNNHHGVQSSARHGLRWWEFDITWQFIRLGEVLGLITKVKEASLPEADDVCLPEELNAVARA
ncbi:stearoyl-CoA desaturase (delta-9 desaturase) [Pseudobacteriovorax antillogorgiicola]|uniref:Stearoyl-CoA desaturase (Delta-9 desaturase) n=2 Tax=Pseudobacteriovorax antillogorgiicola TaxID=1513793 RepID=A0A1Y6CHV7_9BACT|nr:stearoyl-CoA desaturase (delta-9 desaturase) [Pseudobacteriovorax antillogorgiicola]SMF65191.1 stearoyl-CoA desaturase (delta-9 desaturase) [Pseudobacteriovorax antillogorgiicola]